MTLKIKAHGICLRLDLAPLRIQRDVSCNRCGKIIRRLQALIRIPPIKCPAFLRRRRIRRCHSLSFFNRLWLNSLSVAVKYKTDSIRQRFALCPLCVQRHQSAVFLCQIADLLLIRISSPCAVSSRVPAGKGISFTDELICRKILRHPIRTGQIRHFTALCKSSPISIKMYGICVLHNRSCQQHIFCHRCAEIIYLQHILVRIPVLDMISCLFRNFLRLLYGLAVRYRLGPDLLLCSVQFFHERDRMHDRRIFRPLRIQHQIVSHRCSEGIFRRAFRIRVPAAEYPSFLGRIRLRPGQYTARVYPQRLRLIAVLAVERNVQLTHPARKNGQIRVYRRVKIKRRRAFRIRVPSGETAALCRGIGLRPDHEASFCYVLDDRIVRCAQTAEVKINRIGYWRHGYFFRTGIHFPVILRRIHFCRISVRGVFSRRVLFSRIQILISLFRPAFRCLRIILGRSIFLRALAFLCGRDIRFIRAVLLLDRGITVAHIPVRQRTAERSAADGYGKHRIASMRDGSIRDIAAVCVFCLDQRLPVGIFVVASGYLQMCAGAFIFCHLNRCLRPVGAADAAFSVSVVDQLQRTCLHRQKAALAGHLPAGGIPLHIFGRIRHRNGMPIKVQRNRFKGMGKAHAVCQRNILPEDHGALVSRVQKCAGQIRIAGSVYLRHHGKLLRRHFRALRRHLRTLGRHLRTLGRHLLYGFLLRILLRIRLFVIAFSLVALSLVVLFRHSGAGQQGHHHKDRQRQRHPFFNESFHEYPPLQNALLFFFGERSFLLSDIEFSRMDIVDYIISLLFGNPPVRMT